MREKIVGSLLFSEDLNAGLLLIGACYTWNMCKCYIFLSNSI